MSVLRVSSQHLESLGEAIASVVSSVRFDSALLRPVDDVVQSGVVASSVARDVRAGAQRAELTATRLETISHFPPKAAGEFADADSRLAAATS